MNDRETTERLILEKLTEIGSILDNYEQNSGHGLSCFICSDGTLMAWQICDRPDEKTLDIFAPAE